MDGEQTGYEKFGFGYWPIGEYCSWLNYHDQTFNSCCHLSLYRDNITGRERRWEIFCLRCATCNVIWGMRIDDHNKDLVEAWHSSSIKNQTKQLHKQNSKIWSIFKISKS